MLAVSHESRGRALPEHLRVLAVDDGGVPLRIGAAGAVELVEEGGSLLGSKTSLNRLTGEVDFCRVFTYPFVCFKKKCIGKWNFPVRTPATGLYDSGR